MDRRLLDIYNEELGHLRSVGVDFAKEYPKIAGRLGGVDEFQPCQDPFVERLIEGVAFLAARVKLKLEAEFPRFTQSLLDTVFPHYLAPVPSMTMVRFCPDYEDGGLAEGVSVARGTSLFSKLGKTEQTRCEYRTAHDVMLLPVEIVKADYYTRELASLEVPETEGVKAGVRIRLRCTAGLTFDEVNLDSLVLYLQGSGSIPMRLYEQFFAHTAAVVVQPTTKPKSKQTVIDRSSVKQVGFNSSEKMIPYDARSFEGYRLLHEYFTFPQRFMFAEFGGLKSAVNKISDNELDIIILLREADVELESVLSAENFAMYCSPAINLFEKRVDRIHLNDKSSEFHVVPDRTRPQDFEVYDICEVIGFGSRSDEQQEFRPFYKAKDVTSASANGYYVKNRIKRAVSQGSGGKMRRSRNYSGSEVYLSLVDTSNAPYSSDLKQLGVKTLCTNRDMPLFMPIGLGSSDFNMELSVPCISVKGIVKPTAPKPSYVEGDLAWRAINHMSLNYMSLADTEGGTACSALRDILRLYSDGADPQIGKQIEGVTAIESKTINRRVMSSGAIAFARGLEITVTMDESLFEGTGIFLLGAVLDQFFARYVSINSFTETVIRTVERGEVMRWNMRQGIRPIL